jgi:hypothetical protein
VFSKLFGNEPVGRQTCASGPKRISAHRVIPQAVLGSVMASSDNNAAATWSVISPADDVPDATQRDCEPDAGEIAVIGVHQRCPYCPYTEKPKYWKRIDHFHDHIRAAHPDERIPEPEGYSCPCHGRQFATRWQMKRHTNGRLRVPCSHCGRPITKASLARHLLACVQAQGTIKKHKCEKCDRVFSSRLGLMRHDRLAHLPKQNRKPVGPG